jgi:flavin-binding protein dodecin
MENPLTNPKENHMADNTYRVIEIVGTSTVSLTEAIKNGIARAGETLRELDWFEVTNTRGHIETGEVAHFQVTLKVGFKIVS